MVIILSSSAATVHYTADAFLDIFTENKINPCEEKEKYWYDDDDKMKFGETVEVGACLNAIIKCFC